MFDFHEFHNDEKTVSARIEALAKYGLLPAVAVPFPTQTCAGRRVQQRGNAHFNGSLDQMIC